MSTKTYLLSLPERLVRAAATSEHAAGLDAELIAIALSGGVSIDRARTVVREARRIGAPRGGAGKEADAIVTAYVTQVMPNGNLVIEGAKEVAVNSERQLVWMRGVVRQMDLAQDNSISSARIALLDLRVNGKGVVQDAIRRPNPIYRIFRKLLPF